jgi:hypothetical protein
MSRPPLPPFSAQSAAEGVRLAEDAWNTRDPERVALAYTVDSAWRNRTEFFRGRDAIVRFLKRKWARELDYRRRHLFRPPSRPASAAGLLPRRQRERILARRAASCTVAI